MVNQKCMREVKLVQRASSALQDFFVTISSLLVLTRPMIKCSVMVTSLSFVHHV